MANVAIGFGAVLLALGVITFLATGGTAYTALIPAAFGLILIVLGAAGRDASRRKTAMHIAAAVGLLGFLGGAMGIPKVIRILAGESVVRPNAAVEQTAMSILCLVFVLWCVRSFVNARRAVR